jgi:hypothetical protein
MSYSPSGYDVADLRHHPDVITQIQQWEKGLSKQVKSPIILIAYSPISTNNGSEPVVKF